MRQIFMVERQENVCFMLTSWKVRRAERKRIPRRRERKLNPSVREAPRKYLRRTRIVGESTRERERSVGRRRNHKKPANGGQ